MTNFIKDNTSPGAEKSDYRTQAGIPDLKKIQAADWNTFRQALLDIQDYLRSEVVINVRNYGAVGDGVTDDTNAINAAIAAASAAAGANVLGAALYFPHGKYMVGTTLTPPSYVTLRGESRYTTTLEFTATGRMFEFVGKYGVGFQDLQIKLPLVSSPSTVTAFYLSNCFRFTFHRVIVTGNHAVGTPDPQSTGIELRDNTGDSRIIDCDINACGAGIRTSSIQNYAIGCVFGTNKYSIYGDGDGGIVVQSCTFVGTGAAGGTEAHIIVDQSANMWRVIGSWLEGCRVGIQIGAAGVGGPLEFGIISCKIAAVDTAIDIQNASLPVLINTTLAADTTGTPTTSYVDVAINAADCPYGTAIGIRAGGAFDLDPAIFPAGWSVMRRGAMRLPNLVDVTDTVAFSGDSGVTFTTATDTTPAVFNKGAGNSSNLFEFRKSGGLYVYADAFGNFVSSSIRGTSYVQVGAGSTRWYTGTGSPEGAVAATVGCLYSRTDGGAGTTLYVKESGSGNTGWVAK